MKNIHVLPTNKPSSLYFEDNNSELIFLKGYFVHKTFNIKPQNIYITSDEEIKEGDWFLDDNNQISHSYRLSHVKFANPKKIILTTDQDLIKDGVKSIDDEFLEWFVNNPSCEEVGVVDDTLTVKEMSSLPLGTRNHKYKIIIPKEEPKQDLPIVNGSYGCTIQTKKQEPKQETLEELKKWREEVLIAHEINQKVIKKLMDEKSEQIDSEKKIDKILQKLEEIKIMINIR